MDSPTYLLLFLLWRLCECYELLDSQSMVINGGDALYYTYKQRGVVIFSTISYEGDVDIYVSSTVAHPGWDNYEYSAISTGVDTVLVPHDAGGEMTLHIGLHGHDFHNKSVCCLLIIAPSHEDIRKHQVWEFDPTTKQETLVIDIDPLWMKNDPNLHRSIETYATSYSPGADKAKVAWEWFVWIMSGILKIAIEIFL